MIITILIPSLPHLVHWGLVLAKHYEGQVMYCKVGSLNLDTSTQNEIHYANIATLSNGLRSWYRWMYRVGSLIDMVISQM